MSSAWSESARFCPARPKEVKTNADKLQLIRATSERSKMIMYIKGNDPAPSAALQWVTTARLFQVQSPTEAMCCACTTGAV